MFHATQAPENILYKSVHDCFLIWKITNCNKIDLLEWKSKWTFGCYGCCFLPQLDTSMGTACKKNKSTHLEKAGEWHSGFQGVKLHKTN